MMKKAKKSKMGRPPKPPNEKQSECIMVRVTKAQRRFLEKEAKRRGLSLSGLLMLPWLKTEKGDT